MKKNRTFMLLAAFIFVAFLAAFKHFSRTDHPDSITALSVRHDDYQPLIVNGKLQPNIYTHRMLNGLLINLKKDGNKYSPILGVYSNSDGAKVHVKNVNGIISVHTHALIPTYILGEITIGAVRAEVTQIPPDHYRKGPSKFMVRFNKPLTDVEVSCKITKAGNTVAMPLSILKLNSRNHGIVFSTAFVDYPINSNVDLAVKRGDLKVNKKFRIHELPPEETLSRTLFDDGSQPPRFE